MDKTNHSPTLAASLASALLEASQGQNLEDWLRHLRDEERESWEIIARRFEDTTGISVSWKTVLRWGTDLGLPAQRESVA